MYYEDWRPIKTSNTPLAKHELILNNCSMPHKRIVCGVALTILELCCEKPSQLSCQSDKGD